MNKILESYRPSLGCDPEFFFKRNGQVIGSEKVFPPEGIIYRHGITTMTANRSGENKMIMDGVQVEVNPLASPCRETLSYNIGICFNNLKRRLDEINFDMSNPNDIKKIDNVETDFSRLVEVSQEEMDSLSGASKVFGCMPSFNAYGEKKAVSKVNPLEYRFRSAGGHIHIGNNGDSNLRKALKKPKKFVPLLDVLVGNTCVLLDRDNGNIERRKVYGRAGEYRTPVYGVEYRTLSNFWLQSYPLMSFAMGMTRFALDVFASGKEFYQPIMDAIDIKEVRQAINENDFELAYSNFSKIEPIILEMVDAKLKVSPRDYPLTPKNINAFKHFIKMGIDYWFPREGILERWLKAVTGNRGYGWESYLLNTVKADIQKLASK